jgi:nicotinate-nucleotide pyrophosphorylase (carboxylating)
MDLTELVRAALDEDIGPGDITTEACIDAAAAGEGILLAKQDLVVCGHRVAKLVFKEVARRTGGLVSYEVLLDDGARTTAGTTIAHLRGSMRTLLIGERVALNFFMRMSGIATHVGEYVEAAGGALRVVDTRKTTPLLRSLEKYAVRTGGAYNHRHALYDGVLIKDNHIAAVGSIGRAVTQARATTHHLVRIEVEAGTLEQLDEALRAGADAVLLDNMDDAQLGQCVEHARALRPEVILEASGNMTPERIRGLRDIGLDVVSAGGLVHQARWVDLSLDIVQS